MPTHRWGSVFLQELLLDGCYTPMTCPETRPDISTADGKALHDEQILSRNILNAVPNPGTHRQQLLMFPSMTEHALTSVYTAVLGSVGLSLPLEQ